MTLRCWVALSNPSSSTKPLPHSRHELDELCPCPKGKHRLSDISREVLLSTKRHFQARDKILQTYCRLSTTNTSKSPTSHMYAWDPNASTKSTFDFYRKTPAPSVSWVHTRQFVLWPTFLLQILKITCKSCSWLLLRISFGTSLHFSLGKPGTSLSIPENYGDSSFLPGESGGNAGSRIEGLVMFSRIELSADSSGAVSSESVLSIAVSSFTISLEFQVIRYRIRAVNGS